MRNLITHPDKLVLRHVYVLVVITAFLSMLTQACAQSGDIGKLINANGITFYKNHNGNETILSKASPAIIISESDSGRYRVMAVNGQVAWIKKPLSRMDDVLVKARTLPFNVMSPTHDEGSPDFHWYTIEQEKTWRLISASKEVYSHTPVYLAKQGLGNLLPDNKSPYVMPVVQLKSGDEKVWARMPSVLLSREQFQIKLDISGLVLRPFLGLLSQKLQQLRPPADTVFVNFSGGKTQEVKLPSMPWQMESMLFLPSTSKSKIEKVVFYSCISQESYAIVLHWHGGRTQYLAYSGMDNGVVEHIPTPMFMDYNLSDVNKDGNPELELVFAHIFGDGYTINRLLIGGVYNSSRPDVRVIPTNP